MSLSLVAFRSSAAHVASALHVSLYPQLACACADPGDGTDAAHPLGNPPYLQPHQPSGCGYFDVCPTNLSRAHFMDHVTVTKALETLGMMVSKRKPFCESTTHDQSHRFLLWDRAV